MYLTEKGLYINLVKEGWAEWLSNLTKWDWFVTLTFRNHPGECPLCRSNLIAGYSVAPWTQTGWKYAKLSWKKFVKEVERRQKKNVEYVRILEMQKRGVPHVHALITGVKSNVKRLELVDWAFEEFGITRVMQYKGELGAGYYLAKYLYKEGCDVEFSEGIRTVKMNV